MNNIKYLMEKFTVFCKKVLLFLFPRSIKFKIISLKDNYLKQLVYNYYDKESIKERRFYNIGAGNQRSKFDIWSYIDLETSKYSKNKIDIFHYLESLSDIPLPDNHAEIIFNSFVIEHISIPATKKMCEEAFRILKSGGVFHSKIHCYEYGIKLLNNGLLSPNIPFGCRESLELVVNFLSKHKNKVKVYFNKNHEYVIESLKDPKQRIVFDAADAFVYHNATAAIDNIQKHKNILKDIDIANLNNFYGELQKFVDPNKKQSYQHNADYFSKEDLFLFIKKLGFSEVYFTQPYQSVSPALWEDRLNPIHYGFLYAIEAIK